jgi:exodeoxyribonuclease V gamma subunit
LALLPSGPLGERQLAALRADVQPYATALRQWRQGERSVESRPFELDVDGVCLYGHLEGLYPHGALRMRLDTLHGPAQIAHGLDWLVLSALGDARPLAQLAQWDDGEGIRLRPAISRAQARAALRELLALYREGMREPLPVQARSAWLWYDAPRTDEAGKAAAWKAAREQWFGDDRRWGEVDSAAVQLALRGRDPFLADNFLGDSALDDNDGARFRNLSTRLFDAVVHGRTSGAEVA